jgi:hypothetical protein
MAARKYKRGRPCIPVHGNDSVNDLSPYTGHDDYLLRFAIYGIEGVGG